MSRQPGTLRLIRWPPTSTIVPVRRHVRHVTALLTLLGSLSSLPACSIVLDPDQSQCVTTSDCTARGFADAVCNAGVCAMAPPVDPVWGCLGDIPNPVPDPTKKVTFTERMAFQEDESAATNIIVDVCDSIDIDCTSTDPNFPKGLVPDSDGNITITVIQGFNGFVRVTPTTLNYCVDSRVFIGRPLVAPPSVKEVRLIKPADYDVLVEASHLQVDATRGTAIFDAEDCSGNPVAGITFTCPDADSDSQVFYLINQFPELPPMATSTDADGFGGFINLPVGDTNAKSIRASDMKPIGESSFQVLANTISYVLLSPTPGVM
jgi:hypothetical protein